MAVHRALVLDSFDKPMSIQTVPKPLPGVGEVVVRVLATYVVLYASEIFDGTRPYPLTLPLIPGHSAIGRIEETGPDAIRISKGKLVLCNPTIRSRDDPDASILLGCHGGFDPAAKKLMNECWRDGTYAEFTKFPLENVFALDEDVLVGEMGYSMGDLCWILSCLTPFAGLHDLEAAAGETVIICPATGRLGGAAVPTALAMGARVVAAGRNQLSLEALMAASGHTRRLKTVALHGDVQLDAEALRSATQNGNGAECYLDFSPPNAGTSTHFKACLKTLRPRGRCALMGGMSGDIALPYTEIMFKNLQLRGRFVFERSHILRMIQLVESGNLKLGKVSGVRCVGPYKLEEIEEAMLVAAREPGWGSHVILSP